LERNSRGQQYGKDPDGLTDEEAFWHELVSVGVGGRTVEEAKRNVSYDEFIRWCQFREKYGSLHVGMRVDRAIARGLALYVNSLSSRKVKPQDFSPYDQARSSVDVDDPEAMYALLKGVANGNTRDTDP
jgi:hypothetical protein